MATAAIVELDLRRDLPKVVEALPALIASMERGNQACEYAAPCVIGAMVPQARRHDLDNAETGSDDTYIGTLVRDGIVSVPTGQIADFVSLQRAFDSLDAARLRRVLSRVRAKYRSA